MSGRITVCWACAAGFLFINDTTGKVTRAQVLLGNSMGLACAVALVAVLMFNLTNFSGAVPNETYQLRDFSWWTAACSAVGLNLWYLLNMKPIPTGHHGSNGPVVVPPLALTDQSLSMNDDMGHIIVPYRPLR
jgi:hypothetical protein